MQRSGVLRASHNLAGTRIGHTRRVGLTGRLEFCPVDLPVSVCQACEGRSEIGTVALRFAR